MLKELHLKHTGPAPKLDVEFADRLNIFTGDNGLGKSFLLDVAWWALTGNWADQPALPRRDASDTPEIDFRLLDSRDNQKTIESLFIQDRQEWKSFSINPLRLGLTIYSRIDGGFSVCDPIRTANTKSRIYNFNASTLWNGLRNSRGKVLCNGLIQDWVSWQNQPNQTAFDLLRRVIRQLAHPNEPMEPGEPRRLSIEDIRDIPTIRTPYGETPVTHASAGVKRILGLAYLLVWSWYEHNKAAELLRQIPTNHMILLIDEVESHLHPQWQRSILPAVLSVVQELQSHMKVQAIVTTHAPLVLASIEPSFDESLDKLFSFELHGHTVILNEIPWAKQGDTVGWLTSDIFGLKQARSREAEAAIEAAEAFMRGANMAAFPKNLRDREQIHGELQRVLPGHDPFWPRWIVTAGVVPA